MTPLVEIDLIASVPEVDPSLLAEILSEIARVEPGFPAGSWTVTVRLTSDDEMSTLHAAYFGDPSTTDVITFPHDDRLEGAGHLGDIAISVDVARDQASAAGQSLTREIAFLAVHGLLHLCGYDDTTAELRMFMLARQEELLTRAEETRGTRL